MQNRIICQKCKYYYVTWEQGKPHGCKAYSFKSKIIPSLVVKNSSGTNCSFYQLKDNFKDDYDNSSKDDYF